MRNAFLFILYASIGFGILCAMLKPKWIIWHFFLTLPILYIASNSYRLLAYDYPLTYLSVLIWCVFTVCIFRGTLFRITTRNNAIEQVLLFFWVGMLLLASPALALEQLDKSSNLLILAVFITGMVEPFLLYLICRALLSRYGKPEWHIRAMIFSVLVGVVASFLMRKVLGLDYSISNQNLEDLRQNCFSFGNANLYGMILVLCYPLALAEVGRVRFFNIALVCLTIGCFGTISFYTFSRGTSLVLTFETLLWVLLSKKLSKAVTYSLSLLLLTVCLSVFAAEAMTFMTERFYESNLSTLISGSRNISELNENDIARIDTWMLAIDFIKYHWFGGAGATADAENLPLTIALKYGLLPAIALICMLGYSLVAVYSSKTASLAQSSLRHGLICALAGFIMYCISTGTDLCHLTVRENEFIPQNAGAFFLASTLALIPSLKGKSDLESSRRR